VRSADEASDGQERESLAFAVVIRTILQQVTGMLELASCIMDAELAIAHFNHIISDSTHFLEGDRHTSQGGHEMSQRIYETGGSDSDICNTLQELHLV